MGDRTARELNDVAGLLQPGFNLPAQERRGGDGWGKAGSARPNARQAFLTQKRFLVTRLAALTVEQFQRFVAGADVFAAKIMERRSPGSVHGKASRRNRRTWTGRTGGRRYYSGSGTRMGAFSRNCTFSGVRAVASLEGSESNLKQLPPGRSGSF
jgi:hypothetical protein